MKTSETKARKREGEKVGFVGSKTKNPVKESFGILKGKAKLMKSTDQLMRETDKDLYDD